MKAIEKIKAGNIDLSEDEIIELLRINNFSSEYYDLLAASNALSRREVREPGICVYANSLRDLKTISWQY